MLNHLRAEISSSTNTITIVDHGFIKGQKLFILQLLLHMDRG